MGDSTQPQQKYAGTGENCNIVIAAIFYPVIKTINFTYMLNIVWKSRKLNDFWAIFYILAKLFSALFNI